MEANLMHDLPYSSNVKPRMLSATVGYELLNRAEYDEWYPSLTPSAGYADFKEDQSAVMLGLEAGMNRNHGRWYVAARWCKQLYVSLGIKALW